MTAELSHGHNTMLTDMAAAGSVHPEEIRLWEMRLSIVTVAANALRQIVVIWAAKTKKKLKKINKIPPINK